jgi:hypothetical protein
VRKFGLDKYLWAVLLSVLVFGVDSNCQVHRISAGFNFASGVEFNHGETGNPGLTFKTWIAVNKPSTLHVVPSVTAYNRYKLETGYSIMTNYMFQGDIDLQFTFFQEGTVKAVAFGGGNYTYLSSYYESLSENGNEAIGDEKDYAFGGNIGAGLELQMAPKWDFNVSAKYLFSKYPQFIISAQVVYFFKVRRKAYRR